MSAFSSGSNETLVCVDRQPMFIESESLAGSLRSSSFIPQYLMKAMLGWARARAWLLIVKRILDGRRGVNWPDKYLGLGDQVLGTG